MSPFSVLGVEMLLEHGVQDFDEMLRHLQDRWGPPADLEQTYAIEEKYWERYFVESVPIDINVLKGSSS